MKKLLGLSVLFSLFFSLVLPVSVFAAFTSECTGGTITHSGGNTIHTFTSSGTLDCSGTGGSSIAVLVIGGGGGGGSRFAGGGGAGGYQYNGTYSITATSYSVTVGNGGTGGATTGGSGTSGASDGSNGGNSVFDSITATGGGGGGAGDSNNGSNGGSGGGGAGRFASTGGTGSQGNNGGSSTNDQQGGGSGGGGAGGAGGNGGSAETGFPGGNGTSNSISGASVTYAGGGGGGGGGTSNGGSGGSGGGGNGGNAVGSPAASAGSANTGGGGGGGGFGTTSQPGADGGSGIVIISYTTPASTVVNGTGTVNRLAKFTATSTIANALLSDDGSNTTLTSGNFFMPTGSLFDTVSSGIFSFGTTNATTMTFGTSTQKMIINSKVGISTTTPNFNLEVNGSLYSSFINLLAGGLGLDTYTGGLLAIGSTTATSINIGRSNATTTVLGPLKFTTIHTVSNCNSTTTPSTCGSAPSGSVAMPTGGSTIVVNTTAVTANSQIFVSEDSSLGTRLGITCNTTTGRIYTINARTAGTSFTIKSSANPATNKACLSYFIVN